MDNCCYNRPFDDQSQRNIREETQAILRIQARIIEGAYDLVWSFVLDYENANNLDVEKKMNTASWRGRASRIIRREDVAALRPFLKALLSRGIKLFDAAHISCAIITGCDYFITTDYRLLKAPVREIRIVNPIDFVQEQEG